MEEKITKDMTIGEVVRMNPECAPVFMQFGMHCLWCPSASGETLEQAAEVHDCKVEELVGCLNEWFAANS